MRIITIRHALSTNNILFETRPYEEYLAKRNKDPDIGEGEDKRCIRVGKFLKENGIQIDKFYSSLHLRALKTMKYISNAYNPETPLEYFPYIFERGGLYEGHKAIPGLSLKEVKEFFPNLIIPKEVNIENGWFLNEKRETLEELKERVKKCIEKFKEMAVKCEKEDYTICLISHEMFLNCLYSAIGNSDFYYDHVKIGHVNFGISSFTIDKMKNINVDFINYPVY